MTRATPVDVGPRPARRVALSHTQRLILTAQRLDPDSPAANMGKRVHLRGPVDPERLVRAVDTVVRASDVLRMVVEPGSITDARVHHEPPRRTEVIDLAVDAVDDWIAERVATPIDAERCVYDSVLLRHRPDDWTWWLDLHHVAADAWSSSLVYRATALAYHHDDGDTDRLAEVIDGAAFDVPADVPDLDRIADWQAVLGSPAARPLAPYGPRGPATTRVDQLPVDADVDALVAALDDDYRSLSRELGLLAVSAMAFAHTLRRLDGRDEIVVGVPVHHRSSASRRRLVTPLMEIYPLTVRAVDDETPREQFTRVLRTLMRLLRSAQPGESPGGAIEVVLNVLTVGYDDFGDVPAEVSWVRSGHVDADHLVRSQVFDYGRGDSLTWELDVNHGLSADASWRRLPEHLGAAVDAIVATPDRPWSEIGLVRSPEPDTEAALGSGVAEHDDEPVHVAVRHRLRADPTWIVAEQDGSTVDAAEFDRLADDVAAWLADRGVDRGDRVGIRMPRSVDVLVAVHGVLRAGAAFVMLDPADPPARHDAIADDAGLALILDQLPPADRTPSTAPERHFGLDDLAYVLYTSGSTGAPKGVPISHRGLAAYLRFAADAYVDHDEPVMALHSSLVFDLTVTSLFLTFLVGGRTVVFPDDPVVALGRIARDDRITLLKATPSQLEILGRLAAGDRPLRGVIVGGEAFRRPVAERLRAVCRPGVRIWNEYGPTEAVVGCMIHEYDPDLDRGTDVPIGRAAPGCELRVLDPVMQATPTGAWGELWVRRAGMAEGYLNLPELTAERFVDLDGDGRTWYRTGDRVRVERPGVLVFGGRSDDQVKVNGIRLEPAEVEAALVAHPAVDSALVRVWTPRRRSAGDRQRCVRCGLGADVPGVTFSVDGVCSVCHSYEAVAPQAEAWFRTEADLDALLADVRRRHDGPVDALHLLSGGKDSTYALYQLVERGWRVHALTLDNGFISDGAKANIRRSVADLGITHEFATTDVMNEIFRDSLDRYSNVCQGCYKTIYTMAIARARELDIPVIVTGLSRGQFFETRLVPHQFEHDRFDPDEIDATVRAAREVYHHTPDAVTRLLPEQAVFDDPDVLDRVEFLDFYRYVDVDLADLYRFLDERAPWVRPADTGRSTNCLINVAGISVHRHEQGYHNYAEPYSWDVRLGHKTRNEALDELDDEIDPDEVAALLGEVGYEPKSNDVLTAWYRTTDGDDVDPEELRAHLRRLLPEHAVPSAFVRLDDVPLAASAKIDVDALPAPTRLHRSSGEQVPPSTPTEERLCEIWADALGLERIGVTDDFFDLGGSSLPALEVVATIDAEFSTDLHDAAVFRHRTVRELAPVVDRAVTATPAGTEIAPVDGTPLSPAEEAMLFEYRADPGSPRYNVTRVYTIEGEIDVDRLLDAIRDVAMAHGPLHTSFAPDRRRLDAHEAVSIEHLAVDDAAAVARFADVQRRVPFDLDRGPLVRVHVAATAPAETSLVIGMHHISVDAGSFDVFWDQVAARYLDGTAPAPPVSYAAVGAWQRGRDRAADRRFWAGRSARRDVARPLALAAPTPPGPDGYVSRAVDLHPSRLGDAGGTPFATSMAAMAATLAAFRSEPGVEFGITASTKDHAAAAPLVGYFLNTLPMHLDVDRGRSFADLVAAASREVGAALPHRTYPYAEIVRDARRAGHEVPDVSCLLAYERLETPRLGAASVSHRILASGTSVADISLIVQERDDSVRIGIEHRGDVLDAAAAEAVLDVFEHVLVGGVRRPERSVGELLAPRLADDLVGDSLPSHPGNVLASFVEQAAAHPDRPAVVTAGGEVTYAELAARVAALAARIDGDGVERVGVERVGVGVHRGHELVMAVLGALAAGAAYVPLDPSVGHDRLGAITAAADVDRLLVAAGDPHHGLPADRVIDVTDPPTDAGLDDAIARLRARAADIDPDAPAYVVFTSGSTGRPRGVEVSHRNLAASTAARSGWYDAPPDRFLLTSSIGFDSSMVGLFWPLTTGGTIVLPDDDDVHDVDRLGDLISARRVTHTLMVPSLYRAVLRRRGDRLSTLRVAIVAGEACPIELVRTHHDVVPSAALVDEYGPTEATVWATAQRLTPDRRWVPIGGPIPGVRLRIADPRLHPVPAGVAGELMIAGPTVTAGYVDDPDATAARFVDHDGHRWYRTGDRVRLREGLIEFLGRSDDQLNVGGVRVEPAEIEGELRRVTGAADAVAVAVGDPPTVVAHLEHDRPIDEAATRSALAAALPAGAVPRRIVVHATLPRSAHGKIDRTAVAALPVTETTSADVAPATARGASVATMIAIWQDVLERADVDGGSDFFDLGGDSLAAVEIVTAVGDLVGREVEVAALLRAPTPARLADAVGWSEAAADEPAAPDDASEAIALVTLRRGTTDGAMVVMTAAWDDVFSYQELARALGDEITVVGLTYRDRPGRPVITTVDELVTAAEPLLHAAVAGRPSVALVGWSVGGVVAVEAAERLAAAGVPIAFAAALDTFYPGEHRHLWSNRWWKYRSLLRSGALGEAVRELRVMGGRRIRRTIGRFGRRLYEWSGGVIPPEPERTSVRGFPVAALDHPIGRVGSRLVLYAATTTNPARTVERWRTVADDLEVVPVEGRHRGFDSIMAPPRVDPIAADLTARLRG